MRATLDLHFPHFLKNFFARTFSEKKVKADFTLSGKEKSRKKQLEALCARLGHSETFMNSQELETLRDQEIAK